MDFRIITLHLENYLFKFVRHDDLYFWFEAILSIKSLRKAFLELFHITILND